MMQEKRWVSGLLVALALACGAAHAQEAFTRQAANVRAGPDRSYPLVSQLGPGAPVQVMGCLDDWSWCDVGFDDNRGWVYGPFLLYGVQDDRVPLYTYGPSLGIPIVAFSLGAYWDDHYRRSAWYGQREEWSHRAPPPHRAPTGLPPHAVYTPGMHPNRGGGAPARAAPESARPHEAQRGAAPEHAAAPAHPAERAAPARPAERPTAAPAPAGREAEHSAAPQEQRPPVREAQHAPERPQEAGGQKGGEKGGERGGERGGEKPGKEENR